ncbi:MULTISPECIES: sce7726 family protein [Paraburkholderia]|uniref:sce7726 family protein n=1 Tax=Paraburkholderia TaxID=1822464 RepID=UPI0038B751DC
MQPTLFDEQRIKRLLSIHIRKSGWKRSDALVPEYFVERASRRADLVAVNGHLHAYEIKSDLDHLSRLPGQIETYSRYFELVTVVCTERHLSAVIDQTEAHIGVLCVSADGFAEHRRAAKRKLTDVDVWLSHLPIAAIRVALSTRGIRCPRVGRKDVLDVARVNLSVDDARSAVLSYLKNEKRKQRALLARTKEKNSSIDPLSEHRAMLREYLASRGIAIA